MAKKDQKSHEKKVLTEWQKRNLEFLRKQETKDSEEMTNRRSSRKSHISGEQNTGKKKGQEEKKKKIPYD